MREEAGFWVTVGLVAVVAVVLFKIAALRFGDKVPGLGELGAFI
jgi:hypothetical protein